MYPVSQNYLEQIRKPYGYKRAIRGTIGNVSFTEADFLKGSLSITNQCSDSNEIKIGTVNVGMLECKFRYGLINRTEWQGLKITLSEGLWIERTNSYEYVPLGIYVIDDATYDKDGIKVQAYDYMASFDKSWNTSTTIGSPYSILRMLCSDCRVSLDMTQAQIEALPNGTQSLALYSENDCETYRDVLFWLAQTLGCYATIDRSGKLVLRKYGNNRVNSIDAGLRFDDNEFSDFVTEYSGVAFVDTESEEYIYVAGEDDNKLTYKLGTNPFMQYGTISTRKQMARNILDALSDIHYVPFKCTMLHSPAYDLGDLILFTDGIAPDTECCIMSYEYTFGTYTCEGFGQNPLLATARNKVDKDIAGLMSRTDKNGIQMYTFKNADPVTIGDEEEKQLEYIRFTTMEAKQVTFQSEILVDTEASVDEVVGKVKYYLDGAEVTDYQPTETWTEDGKHIISLYYIIDVEPHRLYQWEVNLESSGGTITVPVEHARGTVWGQGLVAITAWSGFIDAEDTIGAISLDDIGVAGFTDDMEFALIIPHNIQAEDTIGAIPLDDINVAEFSDIVIVNKKSLYYEGKTWDELYYMDWSEVFADWLW